MKNMNLLALLALALVVLSGRAVFAQSQPDDGRGTISVTGTASGDYPPDVAEIVFAVENTDKTVAQATLKNNTIMEKVIRKVKEVLNRAEGDTIETTEYSLHPEYEYDPERRKTAFVGYKVINQVKVKTRRFSDVGNLIDAAAEEGTNRVDSIGFDISDDKEYCRLLLEKATERGRWEAEVVAGSLGVSITGIKDVSVSCGRSEPGPMYRVALAQEEGGQSATPVETGTAQLQASVKMVFFVEDK